MMGFRAVLVAGVAMAAAASATPVPYPAPQNHVVIVDKMRFTGVPSQVRAGDTITWVNRDIFLHSATAKDKSFDAELPKGAIVRTVIRRRGVIAFFCKYHPGMTGRLAVQ
jgi:plastocyanin